MVIVGSIIVFFYLSFDVNMTVYFLLKFIYEKLKFYVLDLKINLKIYV